MQHMHGNIPYKFYYWADPFVHLILLRSSIPRQNVFSFLAYLPVLQGAHAINDTNNCNLQISFFWQVMVSFQILTYLSHLLMKFKFNYKLHNIPQVTTLNVRNLVTIVSHYSKYGATEGSACSLNKTPGTNISYKLILKSQMPLKVQCSLPFIGLELYQLGKKHIPQVTIRMGFHAARHKSLPRMNGGIVVIRGN